MATPDKFGPIDPYKHARIAGGLTSAIVGTVIALRHGDTPEQILARLRDTLERYDAEWANHLWPEPAELERAA